MMDAKLKIYIAPKRGRLPRRYEIHDNRTTAQKLRVIAALLAAAALVSFLIWLRLK